MPVIQQEGAVRSIKGLPIRWGVKAYKELARSCAGHRIGAPMPERYTKLAALIDDVIDAPLPLESTDAYLCVKAEQWAGECRDMNDRADGDAEKLRALLVWFCDRKGIDGPEVDSDRQAIARMIDPAWWRGRLRRVHGRKFEGAAIRLGFVSLKTGVYCSDETVKRRVEQNRRNARILRAVTMTNGRQEFTLADLVAKSTGNKKIRRGELMLRIAGFEEIAIECGHDGIFVTLTCPSKYHAVQYLTGQTNPKYQGALPPDAQKYLCKVWARIRAAVARAGISLYGFRVAEPHHDGCPHWHMVLFVQPSYSTRAAALETVKAIFQKYALAEDGDEYGAKARRCEVKDIDREKGSASAYIAAYVSKNIDGEHVEEHQEGGASVGPDLVGDEVLKPCQRVEAWATKWSIRQFQQIGGAPVTVWRELRRVKESTVSKAPAYVRAAWAAAQRIEIPGKPGEKPDLVRAASFADYLRAQGGVVPGRAYKIGVMVKVAEINGRYGLHEGVQPVGVYARSNPDRLYESVRHSWCVIARGAAVDFPWTRVNNCTPGGDSIGADLHLFDKKAGKNEKISLDAVTGLPVWYFDRSTGEAPEQIDLGEWFGGAEFAAVSIDSGLELEEMLEHAWAAAVTTRANTIWTEPLRRKA